MWWLTWCLCLHWWYQVPGSLFDFHAEQIKAGVILDERVHEFLYGICTVVCWNSIGRHKSAPHSWNIKCSTTACSCRVGWKVRGDEEDSWWWGDSWCPRSLGRAEGLYHVLHCKSIEHLSRVMWWAWVCSSEPFWWPSEWPWHLPNIWGGQYCSSSAGAVSLSSYSFL